MADFNALEYALEGAAGTGGAIGGGYLAVKAGQGLLKRKLDRDAKYDGMSSDLDYQSNVREANAIQDPSERNATLTKLRRDYDDRKWQLNARRQAGETGGKIALGGLGAAAGYGLGRHIVDSANDIDVKAALKNAAIGGLTRQESIFSRADFANPIHGLLAKTGAAAGALSGYQDADKRYWEGRKEIEYISDPEERANRLRDYDSFNSKLGRTGSMLKTSAIRAGIGAGIGYVGSRTAGHLFGDRPQPQPQTTTKMSKQIRKAANFTISEEDYKIIRKLSPEQRASYLEERSKKERNKQRLLAGTAIGGTLAAGVAGVAGMDAIGSAAIEALQHQRNEYLNSLMDSNIKVYPSNYNRQIRKSASFALSLHPNVSIGAKIGAGLGLASGLGIGESDRERENTSIGGRLGKIVGKTAIGGGLGAAAGYGYNKVKGIPSYGDSQPIYNAGGRVRQSLGAAQDTVETTAQEVGKPSRWTRLKNYLNKDVKEVGQDIRQGIRNTTGFEKTIRKSANFQDPATIQRLIQKGSTFIPQDTTGVVSLETTLKGKMQKKKLREPKVPASMGVKEINSMIESGKPVGKYFSKSIRKSAVFQQRGLKSAEFGIGRRIGDAINAPSLLTQAGRYIADPLGNTFKNAANNARGGVAGGLLNRALSIFPNAQGAKAKVAKANSLQGIGDYLHTNEGADRAAIGTGIAAGGGLLALGALASRKPKVLEEEQYKTQA